MSTPHGDSCGGIYLMWQSSLLISFREGTSTYPALGGECSQIFTAAPELNDLKTV